jgi:pimeloyl-ACP methyl ester carboxylesterase
LTTAAAVVTLAAVTACSSQSGSSGTSPSPTTTPTSATGTSAAATPHAGSLSRFYSQHLSWTTCHDTFQCASLLVPIDYSKPAGHTMKVAVIRQPSSGAHEGSLIINPGGPGGSGVAFEAEAASQFSQLTEHFDLVSFDPRGVGLSNPIRCVTSAQLDTYVNTNPVPTTAAERALLISQAKQIANDCYKRNGNYLEHVGTIDQARDMDVLRAALGDSKLTYYGASYGTYIGAKYAQLFPTHIRAMVLDGALDPNEPVNQESLVQAMGFQTDLGDFLAACVNSGSCPLGSTVEAAHTGLEALKAQITAHPETLANGRSLGAGEFFEGLAAGLYSPTEWKDLWTVLGAAKSGNPAGLFLFADSQTERNTNGTYSNLIESNLAINCIDRPSPTKVSTIEAKAAAFAKKAPDFGAAIEYSLLPCAFWRVPPVEQVHPVHAPKAPPILVIGTTRDPATPYVWAQNLARQLKSGVLLTYEGDGHTAYLRHDSCIDAAVEAYVDDRTTPKVGTRCG